MLGLLPWLVTAALLLPRLGYAAADLRQLQLAPVGADETWIAGEVERTLNLGKPLIWHIYPDFYFLAAWVPLRVWKAVHCVTTSNVIVCLRVISLLCFVMVGAFSTLGIARLRDARDGFLFSLLFFTLCVTPELVTRATACQPDLMNLCVFTALFLCGMKLVRKPKASVVALCGLVAGVGMAVKFSTVLVLPALALVIVLEAFALDRDQLWIYTRQSARANRWIVFISCAGLVLLSVVAWLAFRGGSSLGWLPTPAGISNAMGMAIYLVGALVFQIGLMVENRSSLPQTRWIRTILFVGHNGLLMALTFVAAFYLCAPNQWFHLRFLSEINATASMTVDAVGAASSWVRFKLVDVVHPAFLTMAAVGAIIALRTWWTGRNNVLVTDEVLALAWSAIIIAYLLFGVSKTRERYVYPAFPALVCLTWFAVRRLIGLLERVRITSRWVMGVVVVGLMGVQCTVLAREHERNTSEFVDLKQLNGWEVGCWLLANAPRDSSILCCGAAYIPPMFAKVYGLGHGDPLEHLKEFHPQFVVISDAMEAHAAAVPEGGFDEIYLVSGTRSRRFYAALEDGSLGFRRLCEFRDRQGQGFVVYKQTSSTAGEVKEP